jgi:GLPGLI family protein
MRNSFAAILGLLLFTSQVNAQQKKQSGAIEFQSTFDPAAMAAANGMKLSEEMIARMPQRSTTDFELLFTATNASYTRVEEIEDSNSGGGGGGGMRFGGFGGPSHDLYFDFLDHKLTEVFDMRDTTYFLQAKLGESSMPIVRMGTNGTPAEPPVKTITKTDETKKILGFNCNKVVIKTVSKRKIQNEEREITDESSVWYTKELGFDFSPNPALWTEGAVLAIDGKGTNVVAKSIEYRNVNSKDVNLPKKGVQITAEQYRTKLEERMKQARGSRNSGGIRTIKIGQ